MCHGLEKELLQNPGFERELTDWQTTGTVQQILRGNWQTLLSRWSLGFGNDHGPTNAYGMAFQDVVFADPLLLKRPCTFLVYTFSEADYSGKLQLKMEFWGAGSNLLLETHRAFPPGSREKWKDRSLSAVAPAQTQGIRAALLSEHMDRGSGRSFIWFDNASLKFQ